MVPNKLSIGYSPLTEKVYVGKQNQKDKIWVGDKSDITNDFLRVCDEYFTVNTVRIVSTSGGQKSQYMHILMNKTSIEKAIRYLQKQLEENG